MKKITHGVHDLSNIHYSVYNIYFAMANLSHSYHFLCSTVADTFALLIVHITPDFQRNKKIYHFSFSQFLLSTLCIPKQYAAVILEIKHNYPSMSNGRDNIFPYSILNKVATLFNMIVSIPFINNRQHLIMSFRQYNQDGGDTKKK